jgi:hypothetical protein
MIYVVLTLLGCCASTVDFVTSLCKADVRNARFRWELSNMASMLRSDLSLRVSHSTSMRNFGRKFVVEPAVPIQS